MANTVSINKLIDNNKCLVVKVDILGDGSGEETDKIIVDASTFTPAFTDCAIAAIFSSLSGFKALLEFDATTDTPAFSLSEGVVDYGRLAADNFNTIPNTAGSGITGDILMTTLGLGANDSGTILLKINKKF